MKPLFRAFALVAALALCLCLCACGTTEKETAAVCGLVGPTGVGLASLMNQNDNGAASLDYTVSLATSPEEIVGKLTTGEVDFAALPTNLAAALYQKTSGGVRLLALCTGCVLYVVENGDTIHSVADLKGKTILSTGEGANPEYILRALLTANGLNPDTDVTLQFVAENDEMAAALVKGTASVALVPEPLCSTVLAKNTALRVALSVGDEWEQTGDAAPYMGCVVVRTAFADDHPEAVAAFLADYNASITAAQTDEDTVAALCETYSIIGSKAVAKTALARCALTCLTGNAMQPALEPYLSVLLSANPKAVGGTLPDKEFYYVLNR